MYRLTIRLGILSTILLFLAGTHIAVITAQSVSPTATTAAVSEDITFPPLTGPYKVGRTEYEWIDQNRADPYAGISGLKRDLMVYVWFPASPSKQASQAPYMDNGILWDIWAQYPELEFTPVVPSNTAQESMVHIHVYSTSTVDTSQLNYPVLIFEHAVYETPLNYESIIDEVVSHGYIVIGVTHPYSTSVIGYPDGRLVKAGLVGAANSASVSLLKVWTQDTRFVLDQLQSLNTTDPSFKGHLDLDHVGIFGHSFGADSAISVAAVDTRIKAGASLDASGLPKWDLPATVSQPFLFIGAQQSATQATQDKYVLYIEGAANLSFGDFGLLRPLIPTLGTGPLNSLDTVRGIQITNNYLVAFFAHYLKGIDLKWPTYPESHLVNLSESANS